jgi:site-specific DNA recombinase
VCLPDRYDDGGFTGGNMERPALQRLLADIDAGKIDCVVVYKVDRLSRSLMDFAKIMERFERAQGLVRLGHAAVQHDDSMGRLTLNILLSVRPVRARDHLRADARQDRRRPAQGEVDGRAAAARLRPGVTPGGSKLIVNEDEAGAACGRSSSCTSSTSGSRPC